jgi:anaerobic selenocysteine-containing dehydrogenase
MQHHHACSLCEALCGLVIETEGDRVVSIRGDEADPFSRGHICPKAVALQDLHTDPDRLRSPLRRRGDSWEEVGWDEALDEIAARLHDIRSRHGRRAIATYSGNPAAHSYGTLLSIVSFQGALRSMNRFSATSTDQLPHMLAALEMFGHQLLLPVPDIDRTDLFVIFGGNPLVSNGSLMTAPDIANRLKAIRARGGRIIVIDPRRTETARAADEHHALRPGSDALLLLAILQVLFAEGLVGAGPWRDWSDGLAELEEAASAFAPDVVADAVGLDAEVIRGLARAIAAAPSAALYGRMGVCTQRFGGLSAWLVYALAVVTGNLDRPGGLMFTKPAVDLVRLASAIGQRGHFDRFRSRVSGLPEFNGELPAAALAEEIETPGEGQIRALVTIAGNPVLSTPGGARLDRALAGLEFMVSLDMYVTATSRHAHFILPPPSPLERDHYGLAFHALGVRNTVRYDRPVFPTPKGVRPDWLILVQLGRRLLAREGRTRNLGKKLELAAYERFGPARILDVALRAGPHRGLSLAKLRAFPHGKDLGPLDPCFPGRLGHPDKRVRLFPERLARDLERLRGELTVGDRSAHGAEGTDGTDLVLIGRRALRSNNSWMHNSERLVRGRDRCTVLIHPEDAAARGIGAGDRVEIRSRSGAILLAAELDEGIRRGVVSVPHGWGHDRPGVRLAVAARAGGASVNDVTDAAVVDELSGNAVFSGVPVAVTRAEAQPVSPS